MKTLVTGGAGFIGSAVARALLEDGASVRILDNFLTGFEENVPDDAELIRGDLRDPDAVERACSGIDVVFHQAAVRSVPRSVDDPLLTHDCNVTGTVNLLMGAEKAGVGRVVYASSSSVYGDTHGEMNVETLPTNPQSPYAVSKLSGEMYCRVWSKVKGLSTVSLRYFNVFGPGQHPESKYAAVFPAFVSSLVGGRPPEVHWDGEQSRDFTFVDDVARANLAAARAGDDASGETFNIGAGRAKTVNETLRSVSDVLGTWIDPTSTPKRAGDVRSTHADISKANRILGWEPQVDWDEAVKRTVEWFLEKRPVPVR